jgi:hypothetical protein
LNLVSVFLWLVEVVFSSSFRLLASHRTNKRNSIWLIQLMVTSWFLYYFPLELVSMTSVWFAWSWCEVVDMEVNLYLEFHCFVDSFQYLSVSILLWVYLSHFGSILVITIGVRWYEMSDRLGKCGKCDYFVFVCVCQHCTAKFKFNGT